MQASVMISSVVNDSIPCGDLELLKEFWTDHDGLAVRLKVGKKPKDVDFDAIREEIRRHLKRKYGFKAWIFEKEFGSGHNPAEEIVLQVKSAHLVIAVFGSRVGFNVGDQDPLTPTLREWRAALETPLKFRLFRFAGSLPTDQLAGELGTLMAALTGFKMSSGYLQFNDTAQLLLLIDETVQKYLNDAVVRYAHDAVAKTPNEEAETWALTSFRRRSELMQDSLKTIAAELGAEDGMLRIGKYVQPICLQSVPDSFGSADARKFVSYVFDDEGTDRSAGDPGRLAIIACFKGVTDGQIRRFMGNVERIEVYPATWGFYAADPPSGQQAVYLRNCTNSLAMAANLSDAIDWLTRRAAPLQKLAERRGRILDLDAARSTKPAKRA